MDCSWGPEYSLFPATLIVKHSKAKVLSIQDDLGNTISNLSQIRELAQKSFLNLFTNDVTVPVLQTIMGFTQLDDATVNTLSVVPTELEIKSALFDMNSSKAVGPDEFYIGLYQSQWNVVKYDFISLCKDVFYNSQSVGKINSTHSALIPKMHCPVNMTHFRPIGLCNVNFKVLSKMIVDRIKLFMSDLVSEE